MNSNRTASVFCCRRNSCKRKNNNSNTDLDTLVRVGHHSNEQIKEYDNRDDVIRSVHDLHHKPRPLWVACHRRQLVWRDEAEQGVEQNRQAQGWCDFSAHAFHSLTCSKRKLKNYCCDCCWRYS